MRVVLSWLLTLLLVAMLVGCGQKGALYLPTPPDQPKQAKPQGG